MRERHLEILRLLASVSPRTFLMGGFAEDILLRGQLTDERGDLDLLVDRQFWPAAAAELQKQGLSRFERQVGGPSGETLAYVSLEFELPVEVWLCERVEGGYRIVLPGTPAAGESAAYFGLLLPLDTFAFPPATFEGVLVKTVSPLVLCLLRGASAQTRGSAERRTADLEIAELLRERFLKDHDPVQTIPRLSVI